MTKLYDVKEKGQLVAFYDNDPESGEFVIGEYTRKEACAKLREMDDKTDKYYGPNAVEMPDASECIAEGSWPEAYVAIFRVGNKEYVINENYEIES